MMSLRYNLNIKATQLFIFFLMNYYVANYNKEADNSPQAFVPIFYPQKLTIKS
jgi:hypothetical protein